MSRTNSRLVRETDNTKGAFRTIDGHVFDASKDRWAIPTPAGSASFNFTTLQGASDQLRLGIKDACAAMLLSKPPEIVMRALSAYRVLLRFVTQRNKHLIDEIDIADVLYFGESRPPKQRYQLRRLKEMLLHWSNTGAYGLTADLRKMLPNLVTEHHEVGGAVRTMDPETGPLTDIEYEGVTSEILKKYADGVLSDAEYTLIVLAISLAARPMQLAMLKTKDFSRTTRADGSSVFILQVTRLKQGSGIRPRTIFRPRHLSPAVGELVQRQCGTARTWAIAHGIEPDEAPLFPSTDIRQRLLTADHFNIGLAGHFPGKNLSELLTRLLKKVTVQSHRTGQSLRLFQTRMRRTFGTRAAAEGMSPTVIADLMDHSYLSSSLAYIETRPEMMERIDKALALEIAPLAQAFSGTLIARGKNPKGKIIHYPSQDALKQVGECGKFSFCRLAAPLACYTCVFFNPWIDAPHESLLEQLLVEREELITLADQRIATVNDRTILAIADVVNRCREAGAQFP